MIKAEIVNNTVEIRIAYAGEFTDLMHELECIIKNVREVFAQDMGEEVADKIIETCGRMAYTDDDAEKVEIVKNLDAFLNEKIDEKLKNEAIG